MHDLSLNRISFVFNEYPQRDFYEEYTASRYCKNLVINLIIFA